MDNEQETIEQPGDELPAEPAKTFTQEELEKILAQRLARAKSTVPADYEEMKAKAAKLAEIETANMTELERSRKEREEALARAEKAESAAKRSRIEAKVIAAAKDSVDPEAVLRFIEEGSITVGDDGTVVGVEEAVKAVLEARPYLVGNKKTPVSGGVDGGPRGTTGDAGSMSMDQYVKARREGRL